MMGALTQQEAVMADDPTPDPPKGPDPKQDDDKPRDGATDDLKAMQAALRKANKEAEASRLKLKEIEDADKTEQEKLAERAATAESNLTNAEVRALRYEVALDKGLPKSLAIRLQGQTVEEMEADADELLETIGTKPPPPSFDGGARERPPANGESDMNRTIRDALGRS